MAGRKSTWNSERFQLAVAFAGLPTTWSRVSCEATQQDIKYRSDSAWDESHDVQGWRWGCIIRLEYLVNGH